MRAKRTIRRKNLAGRRGRAAMALAACGLCLLAAGARSAAGQGGDVEETRSALEKWVETRRVISAEERDWALGREMLEDRIALVQREIDSLRGSIDEARANVTEADRKRADLQVENEQLKAVGDALTDVVAELEARTRALLPRLPEPLRERIKPLTQQLPDDPQATRLSLGNRFSGVVGILNEVDKFNREISVTSEVRALGDGTSAEVAALYLGIAQAYYVGAEGRAAGVGAPTATGWTWTRADEAAPQVAEAIAILQNEKAAAFVALPIAVEREQGDAK